MFCIFAVVDPTKNDHTSRLEQAKYMRMPITEERPRFILNLKINDLINARYSTHLQAAAASHNFYGWLRLNGKTASAGAA